MLVLQNIFSLNIFFFVLAMFLQESDVFMDAMLAANTMKEPRKRKRKGSISKDSGSSDPKRESGGNNSPASSPKGGDESSLSCVKPTFKVIIFLKYLHSCTTVKIFLFL